jgi:thiol-disulfide isomerase/thioredoxin
MSSIRASAGRPLTVWLVLAIGTGWALWGYVEDPSAAPPVKTGEAAAADNPYLADADLSPADLVAYLERMLSKPEAIRERPGFVAAVLEASDRVLAAEAGESLKTAALLARFETLHFAASRGDEGADEQLTALSAKHQDDGRDAVAHEARWHLLEQRAADAAELPPEDMARLLDELRTFLSAEPLTGRHLRLASRTIGVINRMPDKAAAGKAFAEFGALFAKSTDRKLARYGREIAESPADTDLAGQTLELEGTTLDGLPFDWATYRGKVVLVDFWATWCGPCIAELPNVRQNYEAFHDRGFEVVGISLDEDRADLEQFLLQNPVPWVTLFDEASKGWDHPLATRYGVKAIPFPVLVDKEGKVVSTSARGEELGRLLAQMLPADKEGP